MCSFAQVRDGNFFRVHLAITQTMSIFTHNKLWWEKDKYFQHLIWSFICVLFLYINFIKVPTSCIKFGKVQQILLELLPILFFPSLLRFPPCGSQTKHLYLRTHFPEISGAVILIGYFPKHIQNRVHKLPS